MKQGTKQRIVGTVVLIALALIFLPIIFDGQGSYQAPISSRIPRTPEVPVLPEPEQSRPVIIADVEAQDQADEAVPDTDTDTDDTNAVAVVDSEPDFVREVPELSTSGLPQGWSVRLGSFAEAENADSLVQRLQDAGYRAYSKRLTGSQGELTGVYVGPWLERGRVEEYRRQLQAQFQLSGIVVAFEPEQL